MAEFFSYGEFESSDEVEDYLLSDNDGDYSTILQPFQFEPQATNITTSQECSNTTENEQIINLSNTVRIDNLDWCQCMNCHNEKREIDCLCFREVSALQDDNFEGIYITCYF